MSMLLILVGSAIVIAWGVAHIIPTGAVVRSFGVIPADSRRIIIMEWVAEGLALVFLGVLALVMALAAAPPDASATLVLRLDAGALLVFALWTLVAGFRTAVLPIRICPLVLTIAAVLLIAGTLA